MRDLRYLLDQRADRVVGISPRRFLDHCRVAAGPDPASNLLAFSRASAKRDRPGGPEHHATLLRADAILVNPSARTAGANLHAEAGNVVIKFDWSVLPRGNLSASTDLDR